MNTKLVFPVLPSNLVPRHNLLNRLNEAQAVKLVSIYAPAGYGKSTLVNLWLKSIFKNSRAGARGSWLSLEQQDDDPALFFSYLIRSLQLVDPEIGHWALSLINFPQVSYEAVVTSLINDIAAYQRRCYIVLDDYQVISNETIHHWLTYMVDHLPSNAQLVITSREAPPLPLQRLRIYGNLTELDAEDLRFSLSETKSFMRDFMGLILNDENIEIIQKHTEGWVAGLQIAALSIKSKLKSGAQKLDIFSRLFSESHPARDYFYQEVLNQQSEKIRSFFLKTCVLERFSGSLCDALLGTTNSAQTLEQLNKSNSFLVALGDSGEWYRYHPLFASFLASQLDKKEIKALQIQASQWHEEQGLLVEAIQYAFSAGELNSASRMMVEIAPELISKGDLPLLMSWFKKLPDEIIFKNAYLSTIMGWMLHNLGKGYQSEPYFKAAKEKFTDHLSPRHHLFYLLVMVEILNSRGKLDTALQHALDALEISAQLGIDECTSMEIYSEALRLNGYYDEAIKSFHNAIQKSREGGNLLIEAFSIFHLANLLLKQGSFNHAVNLCEDYIQRLADQTGSQHPLAGYGLIPLAQIYYETNQLDQAGDTLEQGYRLVQEVGMLKPIIRGSILKAKLYLHEGDLENTRKQLYYAQDMADSLNHIYYRLLVAAESADLELRMGNLGACERWLKSVDADHADLSDPLYEKPGLAYASFLIAKNEHQKAKTILEMLEAKAREKIRGELLIKIGILHARNYYFWGNFPSAFRYLEEAVRNAAPIHSARAFLDQDIDLAPLLAVIENSAPSFVNDLIEEFSKHPGTCLQSPGISAAFLTQFNERECEILHLIKDDLSNKEIASQLFITVGTTKWYLNKIYKKLGVKNRDEAIDLIRSLPLKESDFLHT